VLTGEYISKLGKLAAMKGKPILVQYSDNYDQEKFVDKQNIICQSLQEVRFNGLAIVINEKNNICRGGNYFVGLSEYNVQLIDFWKNIEKSHSDTLSCIEFIENIKPIPLGIASNILLASDLDTIEKPDLVIFICDAEGTARLLGLYNYAFGNKASISCYSAACSAAIGIPMGHNKMNVTFIDNSARKIGDYDPDELMITIPSYQLEAVCKSIDECVWGGIDVPYLKIERKFCKDWIRPDKREEV